ncbi:MAG: hypothetical protein O2956_15370, partial [Gemmatimonadetes bacterium]|nr:hypothetical protein [Gemmatimonadota bacterium]
MPQFKCTVCDESFDVPDAALEKFPGWEPKYCREHSPNKKGAAKTSKKKRTTAKRSDTTEPGSKRSTSGSSAEENLTRAQVLEKYTEGPSTGVFTDGSSHPNPGPGGWGFVWVQDGE